METYIEMKNRHSREFNDLPIEFAFTEDSFNQALKKLNIPKGKYKDLVVGIGCGGYMRKDQVHLLTEQSAKARQELRQAIEQDVDGSGFIKEMFMYELANHEYAYTYDEDETINACGFTVEEVVQSDKLSNGLKLAKSEYLGKYIDRL